MTSENKDARIVQALAKIGYVIRTGVCREICAAKSADKPTKEKRNEK